MGRLQESVIKRLRRSIVIKAFIHDNPDMSRNTVIGILIFA